MNQSRSGRGGKTAGNNPELAHVVIAGSSPCSYVLSKRQFLVQDDPKVPDRSGEEKGWEFSRKGLIVQLVQRLAGAHYILFTADISRLFAKYSASGHLYADDVQAYVHGAPSQLLDITSSIASLAADLDSLMSSNRISLNPSKFQLIWLGTRQQGDRTKWQRTKWYGQNGMDKMVHGQNGIGQNGMDKMVRTKWYNFIFCEHLKFVEFNIYLVTKSHK